MQRELYNLEYEDCQTVLNLSPSLSYPAKILCRYVNDLQYFT